MDFKKRLIIKRTASFKNTALLGFLFLIMCLFIMPEARQQVELCTHGTGLIDGKFYYTPEQINKMIAAYGEKGRNLYIAIELTADLFYSIVIALFLCSLLIWSSSISQNNSIKLKHLILLPFLFLLANFFENTCIVWMLSNHAENYFFLILATAFFSFSKLVLLTLCLCIIGWNLALFSSAKFNFNLNIIRKDSVINKN